MEIIEGFEGYEKYVVAPEPKEYKKYVITFQLYHHNDRTWKELSEEMDMPLREHLEKEIKAFNFNNAEGQSIHILEFDWDKCYFVLGLKAIANRDASKLIGSVISKKLMQNHGWKVFVPSGTRLFDIKLKEYEG